MKHCPTKGQEKAMAKQIAPDTFHKIKDLKETCNRRSNNSKKKNIYYKNEK